jgi:hypothetical protein
MQENSRITPSDSTELRDSTCCARSVGKPRLACSLGAPPRETGEAESRRLSLRTLSERSHSRSVRHRASLTGRELSSACGPQMSRSCLKSTHSEDRSETLVIPAKAGIQCRAVRYLNPRLRGNDASSGSRRPNGSFRDSRSTRFPRGGALLAGVEMTDTKIGDAKAAFHK